MDWDALALQVSEVLRQLCEEMAPALEQTAADMAACIRSGGKILLCGNGGSAADAQHFSAELLNRFMRERRPYAAVALTTDTSTLTSIANDYSYAQVFSKQVEALGRPGDILVAISTSGNAENVCRAAEAARAAGLRCVALTGGSGGRLASLCDVRLSVSCSRITARIQEGHAIIIHALCEMVEELLAEA